MSFINYLFRTLPNAVIPTINAQNRAEIYKQYPLIAVKSNDPDVAAKVELAKKQGVLFGVSTTSNVADDDAAFSVLQTIGARVGLVLGNPKCEQVQGKTGEIFYNHSMQVVAIQSQLDKVAAVFAS